MSVSAAQIAEVRRLVNEPTEATYDDDAITSAIEKHPLVDQNGELPYYWDTATTPPTKTTNPYWVEDYDLHLAAADIWDEKAATVAADYNTSADGASLNREGRFAQYRLMASTMRAKRKAQTVVMARHEPNNRLTTNMPGA